MLNNTAWRSTCYWLACFMVLSGLASAQYAGRNDYAAPLEPPTGILHTGGQQVEDNPGFHEYVDLMPSGNKPFLYMHYSGFGSNSDNAMANLFDVVRPYWDEGVYMGVQVGQNFGYDRGDGGNDFSDGLDDADLLEDLDHYRSLGRPIYFRFGYECNGGWNDWAPENYRNSFRRAVLAMRDEMLDAAALWNIYPAAQSQSGYISGWGDYFPGNVFVDWWSIDLFDNSDNLGANTTDFLDSAHGAARPVLVGEATPRYVGADDAADWSGWFANHYAMYRNYAMVKGHSYINWDWSTSRWPTWGDARLDTGDATVRANYLSEMTNPVWQHGRAKSAMRSAVGLAELYVDASASGAGDGSSWEDAFASIQQAIAALTAAHGRGVLRVARGHYPGPVVVPEGVRLYGGYPFGGGVDADPEAYPTVITGSGNSRCVELAGPFALLRGFTLREGLADEGAGALVTGDDATLYHCTFEDNVATNRGGAVRVRSDRVRIAGCVFRENEAANAGGGVYCDESLDALMYNTLFHANSAVTGAAVYANGGVLNLDSCTITHHEGGGSAFTAAYAGSGSQSVTYLRNCIVAFNHPTLEQYAVRTANANTQIYLYNTLFHDNTNGGDTGGAGQENVENAISGDPLFVNPSQGDYRLGEGSPAIDADMPPLRTWLAFDARGLERGLDGDGDGRRGYDLGALEHQRRGSMVLDSAGGIWGFGPEGGAFRASRMRYVVHNFTDASMAWSLGELPEWVTADLRQGRMEPGQHQIVNFSFTDAVAALNSGDYGPEYIAFYDTTNNTTVVRPLRIFVQDTGPRIVESNPGQDEWVAALQEVRILFDEAVSEVSAADLTVDGSAATNVTGSGAGPYVFSGFALAEVGVVNISLSSGGIVSEVTGRNFAGDSWNARFAGFKPAGIRVWREYR